MAGGRGRAADRLARQPTHAAVHGAASQPHRGNQLARCAGGYHGRADHRHPDGPAPHRDHQRRPVAGRASRPDRRAPGHCSDVGASGRGPHRHHHALLHVRRPAGGAGHPEAPGRPAKQSAGRRETLRRKIPMGAESISVIKLRNLLLVTVPPDPDDDTVSALQEQVLEAMARYEAKGLVLDISTVQILDSFFARTIAETVQMVALMGGRTVLAGMRASVAVTATQLGLTLGGALTALDVDRALDLLNAAPSEDSL